MLLSFLTNCIVREPLGWHAGTVGSLAKGALQGGLNGLKSGGLDDAISNILGGILDLL